MSETSKKMKKDKEPEKDQTSTENIVEGSEDQSKACEKEPETDNIEKADIKPNEVKDEPSVGQDGEEDKEKGKEEEEEDNIDPLEKENIKLKDEAQEWKDKYMRLSAEFDNYRRRSLNEKMELTKMAGQDLLLKILPVMDDFDRAHQTINQATDLEGIKEGFNLIFNKFSDYLKQQGLKEIEALHTEFDTDLHEALTKIPAPKKKLKGKVVDVIEKGYTLHDKVVRFSKVVVGD